jgi:DNA repair exonuclease SbcCD ATPase subunit
MASVDFFGAVTTTFVAITCCHEGCGVIFGMEKSFYEERRKDHARWYCPNGHNQFFSGKSEAEKLRDELATKNRQLEFAEADKSRLRSQLSTAQHGRAVIKGLMSKMKVRVAHGVCPCCNRTFQNVARHMKTKHPKWKAESR